jgi:peptidyl-prolyl cis-trans isomerase C
MSRPSNSQLRRAALEKLMREPLTHFALMGLGLFILYGAVRGGGSGGGEAPAAAPVPRARVVRVTAADLATLRAGYAAAWKREPTPPELADLAQNFIQEEILYREAAALGLDADDEVVRRRLIEKMTVLVRPQSAPGEPSEAELQRWYGLYRHRFRQPARLWFDQLYFDSKLRSDAPAAARAALGKLAGAAPGDPPPAGMGDSFVLPGQMSERTDTQVAHLFGPGFARALAEAPVGAWSGPVASNFGAHLVRVTRRESERVPPFEEVRKHVRADWLTSETRGTRAAAESLLPRYRIELEPGARQALGDAPVLAPLLSGGRGR